MKALRCRCGTWRDYEEDEELPLRFECDACREDRAAAEAEDAHDDRMEWMRLNHQERD